MEIQYLTKMKNTPIIKGEKNRGISELKIEKLEQEFNIKFPKAYKEFLFLGGEYQNCIDWDTDYEYLNLIQINLKKSMDRVNLQLKPHFIFAEYNRDQCIFFFLDEGEDPPIYAYYEDKIKDDNGKEVFYIKFRDSFSEYIDRCIDAS